MESWIFDEAYATEILLKHFQTHSLKGFGIEDLPQGIIAAGAIIHYLKDTEHPNLQHITTIKGLTGKIIYGWIGLPSATWNSCPAAITEYSLLKVLDNTVSPMGARLLKRWMLMPLKDLIPIKERLDLVEFFIREPELRTQIDPSYKTMRRYGKTGKQNSLKKINPQGSIATWHADLCKYCIFKNFAADAAESLFTKDLADSLNPCLIHAEKILKEIVENPPALASQRKCDPTGRRCRTG